MMDYKISWYFNEFIKTFKMPTGLTDTIIESEAKGLSIENIKYTITANHSLSPKLRWINI